LILYYFFVIFVNSGALVGMLRIADNLGRWVVTKKDWAINGFNRRKERRGSESER